MGDSALRFHQPLLRILVAGVMFLAYGIDGLGQSSEEVMVERAIALGKSGQIDSALELLTPLLAPPTPNPKACYVAGFLHKERFKQSASTHRGSLTGDRADAVRWLGLSLDLTAGATAAPNWRTSAERALDYLGGSYFDDVVHAVRTFEPGDEAHIMDLFEAHVAVAKRLSPDLDATRERTEVHKNLARAYRQWYESTGEPDHFNGVVTQYEAALAVSPEDITACYNLAVNVYNRGVALIKSMDENTSLGEIFSIQERSAAHFRQALPWFEQSNVLQPNRPETLRGLMIVHHALFDDEQASRYRDALETALKP
jgi:tetratricopeptide (TPR) repeat protein